MGLFVSAQDQKAKKAFQAIAPSRTSVWMPGGVSQARQLIRALTEEYGFHFPAGELQELFSHACFHP